MDDEPDLEFLIRQRFERNGAVREFDFRFARDGSDALRVLDEQPHIDLVLSDINMPRMDGLTLLGELTSAHPNLKVVVVSAYGDMANIRTAMRRGACDFVTKPIDFSDLELTIRKALADLQLQRELRQQRDAAQRARANLARYVPPNMVDLLAEANEPFGPPREQTLAVLFADIIGFTQLCYAQSPASVFALLREFFSRMAQEVFSLEGTLDKYIGDAVMATFGTLTSSGSDANRALDCARNMLRSIQEWNEERAVDGDAPIELAIGLHYGPVLLGNLGDDRRLEFATIGDTVNVASRLERLNRPFNSNIVASDAFIAQLQAEGLVTGDGVSDFECRGPQYLRGRDDAMEVWTFGKR
ncbi:MAG TPA: adenylate/guanylate cyclase domain-containing protein [Alphaproteobacteria bacterium]